MAKTHKVQVTLEDDQYEALARIAELEGKELAARHRSHRSSFGG